MTHFFLSRDLPCDHNMDVFGKQVIDAVDSE